MSKTRLELKKQVWKTLAKAMIYTGNRWEDLRMSYEEVYKAGLLGYLADNPIVVRFSQELDSSVRAGALDEIQSYLLNEADQVHPLLEEMIHKHGQGDLEVEVELSLEGQEIDGTELLALVIFEDHPEFGLNASQEEDAA